MITRNIWLLALAAVVLSGWGCTKRLVGAQSDARPANPSATQPDSAVDSSTEPDLAVDSSTEPDLTVDTTAEPDAVVDPSVTFVIRNGSAETVYLNWGDEGRYALWAERTSGAALVFTDLWRPYCAFDCDHVEAGSKCCISCERPAVAKVLEPGDEVRLEWDGVTIWEYDDEYCAPYSSRRQCRCTRMVAAPAMHYQVTTCAYNSFECWSSECTPDEHGVIRNASVWEERERACVTQAFDVPYGDGEVILEVN